MPFANEIGLIAPFSLLLAFALLNLGKLTADHYTYQWMNVIGAAALTYSVISPLNLGVFITEALWTLIGVYGVVKIYLKRRKQANEPDPTPKTA
ncbi:MAG: transporter [Chloroflexi bacterium]|nr:MAG: transporter [Chloroflexota bacterium]